MVMVGEGVILEKDPSELGHLEILAQAQLLKARRVSHALNFKVAVW